MLLMLCAKNTTAVMEEIPIIKPKEIITMENIENIIESEAVDFIETSASGKGLKIVLTAGGAAIICYAAYRWVVKPAVKKFKERRAEKLETEHADEVTIETT